MCCKCHHWRRRYHELLQASHPTINITVTQGLNENKIGKKNKKGQQVNSVVIEVEKCEKFSEKNSKEVLLKSKL